MIKNSGSHFFKNSRMPTGYMFQRDSLILAIICCTSFSSAAESYYDQPSHSTTRGQKADIVWANPEAPTKGGSGGKRFIVETDGNSSDDVRIGRETHTLMQPDEIATRYSGAKAIHELEEGLSELKVLGVEIADGVRKNGAAGIYNMPESTLRHGKALGSRIGNSMREIGSETAHDMVTK
jgi:hypothetical protein